MSDTLKKIESIILLLSDAIDGRTTLDRFQLATIASLFGIIGGELARFEQAELPEEPPVMSCSLHEGWFRETDYYALRAHAAKVTAERAEANFTSVMPQPCCQDYKKCPNERCVPKLRHLLEAAERRADENARDKERLDWIDDDVSRLHDLGHRIHEFDTIRQGIDAARSKEGKA